MDTKIRIVESTIGLLSAKQVAEVLNKNHGGISLPTLRKYIRQGAVPYVLQRDERGRVGKRPLFRIEEVLQAFNLK